MSTSGMAAPPASSSFTHRLSVRKTTKLVNFTCLAPNATAVFLLGDFNQWDANSHPMTRRPDGSWAIQVPLPHGYQHYLFLVDGRPTLDPKAYGTARDDFGEKVSLVAVS